VARKKTARPGDSAERPLRDKVTVSLDAKLGSRLRAFAGSRRVDLSVVVTEALEARLAGFHFTLPRGAGQAAESDDHPGDESTTRLAG
jgi:hypothetical protein